jgi:hypothetical protein
MIQRIQTIYLVIVLILTSLMFLLPYGEILIGNDIYSFNFMHVSCPGKINAGYNQEITFIGITLALADIISLATIFSYKKRPLQIKLCIGGILLQASILTIIYIYVFRLSAVLTTISYELTVFFPFLSVIFLFLAIKAIKKDEKLIRSIDRIR